MSLRTCVNDCLRAATVTLGWLAFPALLACLIAALPAVAAGGLGLPLVVSCLAAVGAVGIAALAACLLACLIEAAAAAIG